MPMTHLERAWLTGTGTHTRLAISPGASARGSRGVSHSPLQNCQGGCGPSLAPGTYSPDTNRGSVSCTPGSVLSQPWPPVHTALTRAMVRRVTSTYRSVAFNSTLTICTNNYPTWGSVFLKREIIFNFSLFCHPTWVSSQEHRAWWES